VALPLLGLIRMKALVRLILALPFCVESHALDLNAEAEKALNNLSKQLQKSKVIKVGPRLFNRKVTPQMAPKPDELWLGFVGDSSATGAASHPDFRATFAGIFSAATKSLNPKERLISPIRVMYTTEEYSFGYQIGQLLRLPPDRIVIAAEDGAKINSMHTQMLRLLAVGSPTLPPVIFVSYMANDICPKEVFKEDIELFRSNYAGEIQKQFDAIAQLPPSKLGTKIYILQPLDLVNVLANPDLLSQKVPLESHKDVTCEQLRAGTFGNDFSKFMQNSLRGECPGIFNLTNNPGQHLGQVRTLQDAQAEVLNNAITNFNLRGLRIKMTLAKSPREIRLSAGDLANDCFHPSQLGAAKIALQLMANELVSPK